MLAAWRRVVEVSGPFVGDVATLVSGTVAAQAIALLAAVVLARLYSPAEFGVFALYTVVLSITSVVACLSYEPAVVLPKQDGVAARVLLACGALAVLVGLVVGAGVVAVESTPLGRRAASLAPVLWWLPLNIAVIGFSQALGYWVTRLGLFGRLSASRIGLSGATAMLQVGGGLMGGGIAALVAGQIAGQAVAAMMLAVGTMGPVARVVRRGIRRPGRYLVVLRRYRNFPLYSTWGTLMNTAAFQIPQVLLFNYFGASTAGFYFLAYRLISMPMGLVGGALSQVLLQRVSAVLRARGQVSDLLARVVGKSLQVWVPAFLVGAALAPRAFALVFGLAWEPAGRYVQILAPLFLMQILVSPTSVVLIALQRQVAVARIQGLLLAGAVASLLLARLAGADAERSLLAYALCQGTIYALYLGEILRSSATPLRAVVRQAVDVRLFRRAPA